MEHFMNVTDQIVLGKDDISGREPHAIEPEGDEPSDQRGQDTHGVDQ
jgi:hypothetical protein